MKKKTEKTPDSRSRELFKMVYGHWPCPVVAMSEGWLKLGKFVLSLEKKWAKAKKGKRVQGD